MLNVLKKADHIVERAQTWICGAGMFVMMWLVFAMVFFRYVLNDSIVWAEEILRYLNMWLILVGAGLTTREDQHVCIDVVQSLLEKTPKIRAIHYAFTRCAVIFILCFLFPAALDLIEKSSASYATSVNWLPMSAVYWSFPAGAISIVLGLAGQVPGKILAILRGETAADLAEAADAALMAEEVEA